MAKFKLPARSKLDEWVGAEEQPAKPPKEPIARLTIDLPVELHARFKAACAMNRTKMLDEVRAFIEEWTQKHS
jgi:hypothetical protein